MDGAKERRGRAQATAREIMERLDEAVGLAHSSRRSLERIEGLLGQTAPVGLPDGLAIEADAIEVVDPMTDLSPQARTLFDCIIRNREVIERTALDCVEALSRIEGLLNTSKTAPDPVREGRAQTDRQALLDSQAAMRGVAAEALARGLDEDLGLPGRGDIELMEADRRIASLERAASSSAQVADAALRKIATVGANIAETMASGTASASEAARAASEATSELAWSSGVLMKVAVASAALSGLAAITAIASLLVGIFR